MLILSRSMEQTIMIGDDIEVKVVGIQGGKVKLGITAPRNVAVHRREVYDRVQRERTDVTKKSGPTRPRAAGIIPARHGRRWKPN